MINRIKNNAKKSIIVLITIFLLFGVCILFNLSGSFTTNSKYIKKMVSEPYNIENSGLKVEYVQAEDSSVKVNNGIVDSEGTPQKDVYLKLTNLSTQKMTITGITNNLASGLSLKYSKISNIVIESNESKYIKLTYDVTTPSGNNKVYNATINLKYTLEDVYDGNNSDLKTFVKTTYFKIFYRGGNNLVKGNVLSAAAASCDVNMDFEPELVSTIDLDKMFLNTSVSNSATDNVTYNMNLYVNKSTYTTFQKIGLKLNLSNLNTNNKNYLQTTDSSITGTWSGNISGTSPSITIASDLVGDGIAPGGTGTISLTGTIPTTLTSSKDPAVLTIVIPLRAYYNGVGAWLARKGTLTIKVNVYSVVTSNYTSLNTSIKKYEEAGVISEYTSSSVVTAYNSALSNAKNHFTRTDMSGGQLLEDKTNLDNLYNSLVATSNAYKDNNIITVTNNYYEGDQSSEIKETNKLYRVYAKSSSYELPYYEPYVNLTNRRTSTYKGTSITSNLSRTYNYWTVDQSALEEKIEEAEKITNEKYTEDSYTNLQSKINSAKTYLNNYPDGSNYPVKNTTYDTYISNINTAIDNLELKKFTIYFKNDDGTILNAENSEYEYGSMPSYNGITPTKQKDNKYTYTFAGWDKEINIATEDITYIATYTKEDIIYKSTYKSEGVAIKEFLYKYGEEPAYDEVPVKESNIQYDYTFDTWEVETDTDGNKVYTAKYNSSLRKYTITFKNENDILEQKEVEYGNVPTYTGSVPTKNRTDTEVFTFSGWDKELQQVNKDEEYIATYTSNPRMYTSIYKTENGDELQKYIYNYHNEPAYEGAIPTKESNMQYDYTFDTWEVETDTDGNKVYTAKYNSSLKKYIITFKSEDVILEQKEVEYGTIPTYTGSVPIKNRTDTEVFIFNGWDSEIVEVETDKVYNAVYNTTSRVYKSTYYNYDNSKITEFTYNFEQEPEYTEIPVRSQDNAHIYEFDKWVMSTDNDGNKIYIANYKSKLRKYTITFKNGNDILEQKEVEYGNVPTYTGNTPTKEKTNTKIFIFDGWDKDLKEVSQDEIYTATYKQEDRIYKSTYKLDDKILKEFEYKYNEEPTYSEQPTKASTNSYTYEFDKWDVTIEQSGNKIYTAIFKSTLIDYNITFVDGGNITEMAKYNYDSDIILPTPTKTGYTFMGWYTDEELTNKASLSKMPAESITLYAKWEVSKYKVKITYNNNQINVTPNTDVEVKYNDSMDLAITLKYGYKLDSVKVNNEEKINSLNNNILKLFNITSDTNVEIVSSEYEKANYEEVDKAISKVPKNLTIYTPSSLQNLQDKISVVVRNKYIFEQEIVDKYANDIKTAIKNLVLLGEIKKIDSENKNYANADIINTQSELKDKINLSLSDINQINNGISILVYLEVDDITNSVTNIDKNLINSVIENNWNVGSYIDINLFKKIGNNEEKITATNGKIKIKLNIPKELINNKKDINREYKIVRVHNDKAEIIDCKYNNDNTLEFETDKFSTYAIIYKDVNKDVINPKTSDNIITYIILFISSLIGLLIAMYRENKLKSS